MEEVSKENKQKNDGISKEEQKKSRADNFPTKYKGISFNIKDWLIN